MRTPKSNVRFKSKAIGDAQNSVVRTILGNLGDESFSGQDWKDAREYFGNKCAYCGCDNATDRDHIIPINREKLGEHRLGNLVPACRTCNKNKGNKDLIEFCGDDEDTIKRITEYMESRSYFPLSNDILKFEKIQIILNKAYKEVGAVAARYIEMINDLYFDDIFENELPEDESIGSNQNDNDDDIEVRIKVKSPTKEFVLNGLPCKKDDFENHLRSVESCNVKLTLYYPDHQETKIWQVKNFSNTSNLSGNLASGYLRDWKSKGIIGVKLEA